MQSWTCPSWQQDQKPLPMPLIKYDCVSELGEPKIIRLSIPPLSIRTCALWGDLSGFGMLWYDKGLGYVNCSVWDQEFWSTPFWQISITYSTWLDHTCLKHLQFVCYKISAAIYNNGGLIWVRYAMAFDWIWLTMQLDLLRPAYSFLKNNTLSFKCLKLTSFFTESDSFFPGDCWIKSVPDKGHFTHQSRRSRGPEAWPSYGYL